MVEAGGRLSQLFGLPRSVGQIYGLLYLSATPLSLDDICDLLSISKASASTGTRQLLSWGAIRQVWVRGERRDFFDAVPELGILIRAGYSDFVRPRLTSSQRKLESMTETLDDELKHGVLTREEYDLCCARIKNLGKLHKKLQGIAPFAEKFF